MLCLAACALGNAAYASDVELAPVVVSADRIAVPGAMAHETLASSAVRTREDFARSGVQSLSAALRTMPGVSISSFGADHVDYGNHGTEVRLRGASAPATILLNGAPLAVTARLPLSSLPLDAVERIEVLPAGASAYGTGGAINIVTASASRTADAHVGIRRSDRGDRTLSFDLTAPAWRIGVRHLRDGGTAQTSPADDRGIYDHRRPGQQTAVYVAGDIHPRWSVFANHSSMRSIWGDTDPRGTESWDGRWELTTDYLTAIYHTDRTRLTLGYGDRTRYYTTYRADGRTEISDTDYRARTWRADFEQQLSARPDGSWTLRAAVGTERYRGLRGSTRVGSRTQWDGELAYRRTPNPRYESRITLGFSLVDDFAGRTHAWLPKWEQRYRMSDRNEWYTSVAKSFAMPSVSDYFSNMSRTDAHTPETARRYEAGLRHISDTAQWQLAVFHTDVDHKIEKQRKRGKIQITRIGQVRTDGIELSYRYRPADRWYAGATLTYADAREQQKAGAPFVRSGARWLAAVDLGYRTNRWDVNLNGNALIARPNGIDNLLLLNLHARYRISDAATMTIGIDNLLDRRDLARDSRRSSFYTDPRRITVGLDYRFR